ncbi:phosphogluconate dehydrogenase (NAD(+)-dependent, decarboxylating) [Lacticaseibacillus baoqingensis]|uniref:Phosphogluconate dehydrogenase (NAD(+)-dependent, decarboxylating) n=1 Tax=Lacticaseibacillus baoqingensis TaxID=2486013 RepID=A0ABW4E6G9_9LACO|nr:decarboxylating 6-phosphogluconate dehydrogenase [Lacticaseibacillus baoqingensis]
MQVGLIGLGKMGGALAANMLAHNLDVVAYDPQLPDKLPPTLVAVADVPTLVVKLAKPRVIWLMVPAKVVKTVVQELVEVLAPGDVVIDGGNSFYRDSVALAERLADYGVEFLDVGTSGGVAGAREGACLMIGGPQATYARLEPLFAAVAVANGYFYAGPTGAGHYLKMVHNGIEYGMMQAIGEGFELLSQAPYQFDLGGAAAVWTQGSVIRGWLMELAAQAFAADPQLTAIQGVMHSSGEGAWTMQEGLAHHVPLPALGAALTMRYRSETADTMTGKTVAALRNGFGGHAVERKV